MLKRTTEIILSIGIAATVTGCQPVVNEATAPEGEAGSAIQGKTADRLEAIDNQKEMDELPEATAQQETFEGTIVEISPTAIKVDYGEGKAEEFAVDAGVLVYKTNTEEPSQIVDLKPGDQVKLITENDATKQDGVIIVVKEIQLISAPKAETTTPPAEPSTSP
ncbi:hypothetical protein [Rubinisphaera italica]|uniref:DUF5666 domain-containing protein n=1 Tax=Rubinisphaera italica TaxID=2527969 RepID=A0A5C5XJJ3_9PLAN|nr:hypothetical protein [Rubinisphaera italica]TWT62541.1 hypothetical protein Pan54_32830 [Rubinisphaera italica]